MEAFRQARELEIRIGTTPFGKGKPISYTLLPINFLVMLGASITNDISFSDISPECVDRYVTLLDHLSVALQAATAYQRKLKALPTLVQPEHLQDIQKLLLLVRTGETELMDNFARLVVKVRNEYTENHDFMAIAVKWGAQYLRITGRTAHALDHSVPRKGACYVLFFNKCTMATDDKWEAHVHLLHTLLDECPRAQTNIIADCCSTADPLDRVSMSARSNGELKTKDVLPDKKALANKALLQINPFNATKVTEYPSRRRKVVLPCPQSSCEAAAPQDWTCSECHVTMEYSPTTGSFYCDCGESPAESARYNCQGLDHSLDFVAYPSDRLSSLLQSLPPPPEMNILILGEPGVGKSTFINAFVNYITFSTLDEGLEATKLRSIIPCSFKTQIVDPETKRLVSKTIKIGADINEHDGSVGSSATQQATVYPIYMENVLVRLIDTPGIGDTRGHEQDKQNLANVLSVLRNYTELHGILILLKSNMPRLRIMFRFCVKELLSSLHRSAARNIAFLLC